MCVKECVLGMDIGGTNFRMGLVDRSLRAEQVMVYSSQSVYDTGNTVDKFALYIRNYIEKYGAGYDILSIAIGCPSVVDGERRRLFSSTNFPGLENIDLVGELEKRLPYPVMIDHDAYYLLAYDIRKHGLTDKGAVIGCYFGTGLGSAMYIDGRPYIGRNGTACELGHLPIPFNDYLCSCGNRGCIEMFSCGKALERIGQERYPDTFIGELFTRHGDSEPLRQFVEYMSIAVAAAVNIIDPHCVFVGGGIPSMKNFPWQYFLEKVISHTRKPYPAENLDIRFSENSSEKGIIGAAIRAFEYIPHKT